MKKYLDQNQISTTPSKDQKKAEENTNTFTVNINNFVKNNVGTISKEINYAKQWSWYIPDQIDAFKAKMQPLIGTLAGDEELRKFLAAMERTAKTINKNMSDIQVNEFISLIENRLKQLGLMSIQ